MGRPKLNKTNAEIAAQKKRWADRHNESRRLKYAQDARYREKVFTRNRDRYREEHGVEFRGCVSNDKLRQLAHVRPVETASGVKRLVCLDNEGMGEALGGYHKFVLHRWQRTGRFPRTTFDSLEDGVHRGVFLLNEAKALLRVMREHHKTNIYLTFRHKDTIEKLFAAVGRVPSVSAK